MLVVGEGAVLDFGFEESLGVDAEEVVSAGKELIAGGIEEFFDFAGFGGGGDGTAGRGDVGPEAFGGKEDGDGGIGFTLL